MKAEITEGLLWVWRQPFLRAAVGVIGGVNLVFNALTLVLIVRAQELGASPALYQVTPPGSIRAPDQLANPWP